MAGDKKIKRCSLPILKTDFIRYNFIYYTRYHSSTVKYFLKTQDNCGLSFSYYQAAYFSY